MKLWDTCRVVNGWYHVAQLLLQIDQIGTCKELSIIRDFWGFILHVLTYLPPSCVTKALDTDQSFRGHVWNQRFRDHLPINKPFSFLKHISSWTKSQQPLWGCKLCPKIWHLFQRHLAVLLLGADFEAPAVKTLQCIQHVTCCNWMRLDVNIMWLVNFLAGLHSDLCQRLGMSILEPHNCIAVFLFGPLALSSCIQAILTSSLSSPQTETPSKY